MKKRKRVRKASKCLNKKRIKNKVKSTLSTVTSMRIKIFNPRLQIKNRIILTIKKITTSKC